MRQYQTGIFVLLQHVSVIIAHFSLNFASHGLSYPPSPPKKNIKVRDSCVVDRAPVKIFSLRFTKYSNQPFYLHIISGVQKTREHSKVHILFFSSY